MAGVLIVALGLLGVGARLMRWLPFPIVMGMFAGSISGTSPAFSSSSICTQVSSELQLQAISEPGRTAARGCRRWPARSFWDSRRRVRGSSASRGHALERTARRACCTSARLGERARALGSAGRDGIGIGNVQGIGMLVTKGYRPPINLLTVVVGANSVVNALFGGHPSTVARNGVAILASDDSGPRDQRCVANVVASLFALFLALSATTANTLLHVLPISLVAALAGLAILTAFVDALQTAIATDLPVGAFFALAIAASPLTLFGVGSAFWALVGGVLASLVVERPMLIRTLRVPDRGCDQ